MRERLPTGLLSGNLPWSVEMIKKFHDETMCETMYVSKAIHDTEDFRPPTYTVGPYPSDDHHVEDTIAEFFDGNFDGEALAHYFAAAPVMIETLLKTLGDTEPMNPPVKKAKLTLVTGASIVLNPADILAIRAPGNESQGYYVVYLKGLGDSGFAINALSAKSFFQEYPEWNTD